MSGYEERRPRGEREPTGEREPQGKHEPQGKYEEHASHAGNGTVNHGPDEHGQGPGDQGGEGLDPGRRRLEALASSGADGPGGPGDPGDPGDPGGTCDHGGPGDEDGPDRLDPDRLGSDELALRRMLHQAVHDIEPRDGTLEQLRRAVPARRARRRHAVVGVAAAALFVGTAIPALVHVSNSTGSDADPSAVANRSQAQGGATQDGGQNSGSGSSGASDGSTKDADKDSGKDRDEKDKGATSGATGPSASVSPASAPACTVAQLGGTSASVASPDSSGTVYGSFRVANISGTSCTVTGSGNVSATAQGAADPSKVFVADHVASDAATGLPDPSLSPTQMVLQPGAAYVVKFAWVPSETCPTVSDPDPSPDPSATDNTTATGGTTTDGSGTAPQLFTADGVADGSVEVSHTPAVGAPSTPTTVPNACAGTVYSTGLLADS